MSEWRDIDGYNGKYKVSSSGIVKSSKELKPRRLPYGYNYVRLYKDGKHHVVYIHRLVAETFIGKIPSGKEVNHKDGNKDNNSVDNLEIVTHKENCEHRARSLNKIGGHVEVLVVDTGETFTSMTDAAKHLGRSVSAVWYALEKGTKCNGRTLIRSYNVN